MPPDLPRLPQPRRHKSSGNDAATYGALIAILIVGFMFLAMVLVVLPFRGLALIPLGTVAFFAIHYLLWGRLLTAIRKDEIEAEEQRPK